MAKQGFTLIELLVVIAIIAVLAVVVILALNPAALLQQSRDANRLSDLATMNSAFNLFATDVSGGSFGAASTSYISVFDSSATSTAGDQCQGLSLPSLGSSTFECAASSSYKSISGTGWIPANLKLISAGSPLGALPVDPINQTSSGLYYSFGTNGTQFEVTAVMESAKYRAQLSANPTVTTYPGIAAAGSSLAVSTLYNPSGLVGYWNFEEGTGTVALDQSSNGNNGTWNGTPIGVNSSYYSSGKVGAWAGDFDGSSDYVSLASITLPNTFSVSAWVDPTSAVMGYNRIVETEFNVGFFLGLDSSHSHFQWIVNNNSAPYGSCIGGTVTPGTWEHVVGVYDGTNGYLYVNGVLVSGPIAFTSPGSVTHALRIGNAVPPAGNSYFPGAIDDVRVYGRALSAAEVQALYNAQK